MNKINPIILLAALFFSSCATIQPGNDPVIVKAQQTMSLAKATFDLVEKTEYETYSAVRAASPETAREIRSFVNNLRAHDEQWLMSADTLTDAYSESKTAENASNLNAALAVLQAAINESNKYLAEMHSVSTP